MLVNLEDDKSFSKASFILKRNYNKLKKFKTRSHRDTEKERTDTYFFIFHLLKKPPDVERNAHRNRKTPYDSHTKKAIY